MAKEQGPKENRKSLGQGEEAVSQKMVESDDTACGPEAEERNRDTVASAPPPRGSSSQHP